MAQRFILGLITVILAIVIGVAVYNSFKGRMQVSNKKSATNISPTTTQTPLQLAGGTGTLSSPTVSQIKLYFIKLSDNGQSGKRIGCGDSVVSVNKEITPTTMPLTAAYQQLLAIRDQYYGQSGLYNPLYQSDLAFESAQVTKGGTAIIRLVGTQALSGVCDDPRLVSQLRETALQFPSVQDVSITINGYPIEQLLSGKGQ